MASIIYMSFPYDVYRGNIDCDTDTFYVMLATATYSPNQDVHDRRDDITNEVSGTGYTAGGQAATVTVSLDTANNRVDVNLGGATWTTATITARYAIYYKRRGGAASADELVAVVDFGSDVTATAANFVLSASILRTTVTT